ncbi:MAG TPA: hypothetical protein VK885_04190 [Desulfotignum sp.]|jgi:hypothetical protein|nr:hypothetical protein [Desulfotignum sp.]
MTAQEPHPFTVEETARHLADFAVDRTDLKQLLTSVPKESDLNLITIEYELGILKILAVGWGIAYFMPVSDKNRPVLTDRFWQMIQDFSRHISTLTETTTGRQIDYFDILKDRLDTYVREMHAGSDDTKNPAAVMGPVFAGACGCPDNAVAMLSGSKMFSLTLGAVKEYLAAVTITGEKINQRYAD